MKTFTQEELAAIIDKHGKWSRGEADGSRANLSDADLRGANLSDAYLSDADLRGAKHDLVVPVVEQLDVKVLAAIEAAPRLFDMGSWHYDPENGDLDVGALAAGELAEPPCGTTHCRAGWAIHLAGKEGYALEQKVGPEAAGTLIYQASTGSVPNFVCSNEDALEDIRACAAKQLSVP